MKMPVLDPPPVPEARRRGRGGVGVGVLVSPHDTKTGVRQRTIASIKLISFFMFSNSLINFLVFYKYINGNFTDNIEKKSETIANRFGVHHFPKGLR